MVPANFKVVLDANVLYPFSLRDTLLRCAEIDLYQICWTKEILKEVHRNLVKNEVCTKKQARKLISQMTKVFPEAMVKGYEPFISAMKNDKKDRHVAAAALKVGAQVIVTNNLKDFKTLPSGIRAQSPDDFLEDLFDLDPDGMVRLLEDQAADLENPPVSFEELLSGLEKMVPQFLTSVRNELPT
jgi:predicted nucleic acid-binding protein